MGEINIYGLVDPASSELRYVGKTAQRVSARLGGHIAAARAKGRKAPVYCWIRSLLDRSLRPEVILLDVVPSVEWEEAERFWIAYFRSLGARLTNLTAGGDVGCFGFKMPAEAVEKLRRRNLGNTFGRLTAGKKRPPLTAEQKEHMRALLTGQKRTAEARANMSAAQKGRAISQAHRTKLAAALRGFKHSEETRQKLSAVRKGKAKPEGFGAKVSAAKKGVPLSEEHRAKLKAAWAIRRARDYPHLSESG